MSVAGTLTSVLFGTSRPPTNITSQVTRSGDVVSSTIENSLGLVVKTSMSAEGTVRISVEANGDMIHVFTYPKTVRGRLIGQFNSTTTRAAPVFQQLYDRDPTGASWLDQLLSLGSEAGGKAPEGQRLIGDHGIRWGKAEARLPAPRGLLEHLVRSITPEQVAASRDTGTTLAKRQALAQRDEATIAEALEKLAQRTSGKPWYVLEGDSRPDALLEMTDFVLVVEGKRTERELTEKTTWMARRSQLIRHMDAATDYYKDKQVLGLLIVEGKAPDPCSPSEHWKKQSAMQTQPEMLNDSLPHRTSEERNRIAAGVLGVTTWQRVCDSLSIPWPPAEDGQPAAEPTSAAVLP